MVDDHWHDDDRPPTGQGWGLIVALIAAGLAFAGAMFLLKR